MIIALVGAPSAGKTTILKLLNQKGFKVFHADSFISEQYKKGNKGYQIIKEILGDEFVLNDKVNKERLREEIKRDENFLIRLNELIHPIIFDYLKDKDNFIAEIPIVTSSPIKFKYDKIINIYASKEILRKRISQKTNIKNKEFLDFIINKWDNELKYDYQIDTSNKINEESLVNKILEMGVTNEGRSN